MTNTTNSNPKNPDDNDNVLIADLNENADAIDAALHGLSTGKEDAGAASAVQKNLEAHTGNRENPHGVTAEQVGAAPTSHTHDAGSITSGTLPIARGGTGVSSMTGEDYSTSRPRGIVLQSSEPSSVPNGCLVGVYK